MVPKQNILILSDSSPYPTQGTGVCVQKHFSWIASENLYSVYCEASEEGVIRHRAVRAQIGSKIKLLLRFTNRLLSKSLHSKVRDFMRACAYRRALKGVLKEFEPDLVYVIPYASNGLILLQEFRRLRTKVPYIIHLYDWLPMDHDRKARQLLKENSIPASRRWALGSRLAKAATDWTEAEFSVVPIFYGKPASVSTKYQSLPRACILGNVWSKEALEEIVSAWRQLKKKYPQLQPIQWSASEWTIQNSGWDQYLSDPEVTPYLKYVGFFKEKDEFQGFLQQQSLSFIPFAVKQTSESSYAKYSIPSKITELACLGMPFIAVTPENTGLGVYLRESGLENTCTVMAHEIVEKVTSLMEASTWHENAEKLLMFSRNNFDLGNYHNFLRKEFLDILKQNIESSDFQ